MSNARAKSNPPMPLHEVLEEEFVSLHRVVYLPSDTTPDDGLNALWSTVHHLEEPRAALCISGGGIRSATFALGILQGLARCGILPKFHYVSTVSGGGYIGGWLQAWIHNAEKGVDEVVHVLAEPRGETRPNPEPIQIQNLRTYSNYLAPRLGLLSADTWTLIGTYLRNLLLNWFVLIPLLAAVLSVPWIYTTVLMTTPPPDTYLPALIGGIFVAISVAYMGLNLPCGGNRRWSQNRFLIFCLLPALLGGMCITNYWGWFRWHGHPVLAWQLFGVTGFQTAFPFVFFGMVMHLASWLNSLYRAHGFKWKEFLAVLGSGAAGGWLLWLGAFKMFDQPTSFAELYTCVAVPLFFAFFFLAIMVFAGISSRWTNDQDREWWGRATGWFLALAVGWTLLSALVIFGPLLLSRGWALATTMSTGIISGALTIFASRSSAIPANQKEKEKAGPLGLLLSKVTSIAAVLFILILMILITKATTWIAEEIGEALHFDWTLDDSIQTVGQPVRYINVILYTPLWLICLIALAFTAFGIAMAHLINTNKFSLHAMYRDRLIRAYLGASNQKRNPNPFTGFDENDNKPLRELWSDTSTLAASYSRSLMSR